MKFLLSIFFLLSVFLSAQNLFAQDVTFILLRHAEKDAAPGTNRADPNLSAEGLKRAEKFYETVKEYQPTTIYATGFLRTRATVEPLAKNIREGYRVQTQFYDFNELEEFAAKLLQMKSGVVVVAGHNTTTPALANLLIKQEKYPALKESEYNKIWIIHIKGGKIEDKVIEY
jgi:phosphohistidine phosphatase SixA